MRQQFSRTMFQVGEKDPNLFVVVGDIGVFGLRDFAQKWPQRFLNAGIREQSMASVAGGLAKTGFIPVIHSITPFVVERCFEQIKVGLGYHNFAGNIVSVGAGLDYAALGCTHHSYSDIALFRSLPETKIFVPGTPREFDVHFKNNYSSGVNYFRLGGRSHSVEVPEETIRAKKAFLAASGDRVTVVTMGPLLKECLSGIEMAKAVGHCDVVYYSSVKPFDAETLCASVRRTGRVIVAEDHSIHGGLGDQVASALATAGVACKMVGLGVQDQFLHSYGSHEEILKIAGIDATAISKQIALMLDKQ